MEIPVPPQDLIIPLITVCLFLPAVVIVSRYLFRYSPQSKSKSD